MVGQEESLDLKVCYPSGGFQMSVNVFYKPVLPKICLVFSCYLLFVEHLLSITVCAVGQQ